MLGGLSESRGSLETDGRNAWYCYETRKKAPLSAVYSESHPLIIYRLKAYDFGSLLARRNNPRGMTMEERLDVRDLNFLKERYYNIQENDIQITFTGIVTGERFPITFTSIKPNHSVAFAAYSATSYCGPITAETNYDNMTKPEVVLNAEAEMSEVGRLLDFPQHHETLQNFYNSLKVLKSRHRRLKFMNRFSNSVFERMVTAAGASSHMRADQYLAENKAFIFAFEINSSFSTRREKKGRPSIHLKLERYLIQKVHLFYIASFSWPSSCWD